MTQLLNPMHFHFSCVTQRHQWLRLQSMNSRSVGVKPALVVLVPFVSKNNLNDVYIEVFSHSPMCMCIYIYGPGFCIFSLHVARHIPFFFFNCMSNNYCWLSLFLMRSKLNRYFSTLTHPQHVKLHANIKSAITWNVFFYCLGCFQFCLPYHKSGIQLQRPTHIYIYIYSALWECKQGHYPSSVSYSMLFTISCPLAL